MGPSYPSTTTMKRFFKTNRKKTPKPPQQPIPPEKPAYIAAGPPNLREELDVRVIPSDGGADHTVLTVPSNEGGRVGPQGLFQDGMDGDQELPAPGAATSVIAIGGADHGDQLPSKCS